MVCYSSVNIELNREQLVSLVGLLEDTLQEDKTENFLARDSKIALTALLEECRRYL